MPRSLVAVAALVLLASVSVAAADGDKAPAGPIAAAVASAAKDAVPAPMPVWAGNRVDRRPSILTALYASYGAVQTLELVSTHRAIAAGAAERNPLMKSGNMAAMIGVKAAAGAATIYFAERAWKKNRVGAIVLMAVLNGATAAIAARNLQHARR